MMSSCGLDNYLVILNAVLLTKRGATIPEILKGLKELSGMDGNVQQYGFPNLETLLKSYPDIFRLEGKKWYGKVTKENEDLVRSMATEKPRKRGKNRRKMFNSQGFRAESSVSRSASNRGPNRAHSDFEKKCRIQENRQPLETESKGGHYKKSDEVEFGKRSSSYASKKPLSTNRVAAFSHVDRSKPNPSNPEGPYFMAPLGFENQRPFYPKRDRYTLERRIKPKCCRNMASGRNVARLCSPGLNINVDRNQLSGRFSPISNENRIHDGEDDTNDWSKEMRSVLNSIAPPGFKKQHPSYAVRGGYTLKRKMKYKSFCNVLSGGNVAPLYPSGLNINVDQNQLSGRFSPISNENRMHGEEDNRNECPKQIRTGVANISGERCTDTSEWDPFDHTIPPGKAVRNPLREYLNGRNMEESEELKTAKEGSPRPEVTLTDDEDRGRLRKVPYEPRRYEMNNLCLLSGDKVQLTCFVTLEEFYVRSCAKESSYKRMLEDLRIDYKNALENSQCVEWMKGDGVAVWYNRVWQRGIVCDPVRGYVDSVDIFLIDVGATVVIGKNQLVPLCDFYLQIAPYAICCSVGPFQISSGKRFAFAEMCKQVTDSLMEDNIPGLDVEILDKVSDGTDRLKVKLTYKELSIPDCFVQANLITLK